MVQLIGGTWIHLNPARGTEAVVAGGARFVEIFLSVVDLVRALVPDLDLVQGQAHKTHEDASTKKDR